MRTAFIASLILTAVLGGGWLYTEIKEEQAYNALSFSKTQEWGTQYLDILNSKPFLIPNAGELIRLHEPPLNSSEKTRDDLATLHALTGERTTQKIEAIQKEMNMEGTTFGPYTYTFITDRSLHPFTDHVLYTAVSNMTPVIMFFKEKFNRVRPSFLDPSLTTVIDVPPHPAYPSGHAAQSQLIARILSDIDPTLQGAFLGSANSIARNREIAGVHYPSDSEAGRVLADEYYKLLKETSWYRENIVKAKAEWQAKTP